MPLVGARRSLLSLPWTPKKLGPSLVLWLDPISSPKTLSTASYAGAGTVTQSGTTLTGSLSSFLGEVKLGDVLTADAGSPLISGTVTAIASATSLTLSTSATQAAGQTYKVFPQAGATDRVSQINDLSGLGNHASQATANLMPSLKPNALGGRPALFLDGVNDLLGVNGIATTFAGSDVPMVLAFAGNADVVTSNQVPFFLGSSAANNPGRYPQITGSKYKWVNADDAAIHADVVETIGTANTSPHVFVWDFSGTTITVYVDGVALVDLNGAASDVGTATFISAAIGARALSGTAGQWWPGLIGELILTKREVTKRELFPQLTRYLGRRSGVAVAG